MDYVEYPTAKTWADCVQALKESKELWAEWEELPEDAEEGECYEIEEGDIAEMMDGCSFTSEADMTYTIHIVPVN
jgi:hypothetical protein